MVTGPALVIAIVGGLLFFGVSETVKGVKKVSHAVVHVFHHPKKPVTSPKV